MRHFRAAQFMLPAIVVVLTACASQRAVPADHRAASPQKSVVGSGKPQVSEQSVPLRQPESPIRTVVHGDTLYSIAWETGRDYRELAKWNRIQPPYTIQPGQALRVIPPAAEKVTTVPAPAKPSAKNTEAKKTDIKPSNSSKPGKLAVAPTPTPSVSKPAGVSADSSKTKIDTRTKTKAEPVKSQVSGKTGSGLWAWPADGQILKRYGESDSGKGLDIGGTRGQSVRATAGGRVVYQGSGLRGYGQLIIIKHSDEFLSAYAHNDRIYVKEGDVVKRGQKIADMGSTGTDRVKLHFEIRRQGVPTDPLNYLPKR
ncbi:MAG: peptidase [Proteobacteria bacterium]|nr:peptidase [Pseudomonadota bacterium]